jgi:single-stranded-DNA-specific exonuclease
MTRTWRLATCDPAARARLVREAGVHEVVAQLLVNRGHASPDAATLHLSCKADGLHDPALLPGVQAACERLARAIERKERVLVHGDYDVDGVCGTALLVRLLRLVGADVAWHIPNRLIDGYSFGAHSVRRTVDEGAKLCISVDNGTSAFETIAELAALGVDTIVTDHHEPPLPDPRRGPVHGALPCAAAIVNPKLTGSTYPWKELCGTAVAFKLAWGLLKHVGGGERVRPAHKDFLESALALVALATVADVVPLVDENRVLVAWGLKALRHKPSAGLAALLASAKLDGRTPTADEVAFQLAPRINAAGRLGAADRAVELLLTEDGAAARRLAAELDDLNQARRTIERKVFDEAFAAAREFEDAERWPVLVVAGRGWHQGVVGIVASKLVERFGRPALVIGLDELPSGADANSGRGRGSARSVPGFDLLGALHAAKDVFLRYGGHEQAAGCEIEARHVDTARELVCAAVRERNEAVRLGPGPLEIDLELPFGALDETLMRQIERLEPFGAHNKKPVFLSRDLRLANEPRVVGGDGTHLVLELRRGERVLKAMAFGAAARRAELRPATPIHIVYTPRWNTYRGNTALEVEVLDFRVGLDGPPLG